MKKYLLNLIIILSSFSLSGCLTTEQMQGMSQGLQGMADQNNAAAQQEYQNRYNSWIRANENMNKIRGVDQQSYQITDPNGNVYTVRPQ